MLDGAPAVAPGDHAIVARNAMTNRTCSSWLFQLAVCVLGTALIVGEVRCAEAVPEGRANAPDARPVTSIDFYGQRNLDEQALRQRLALHEGDMLTRVAADAYSNHPESLLPAMPGIQRIRVDFVCCSDRGGIAAFIGVEQAGSRYLRLRQRPTGKVQLTDELVKAHREVEAALFKAVQNSRASEDDSEGHALAIDDPDARAAQLRMMALVAPNLKLLREVLRDSANDAHRAAAAAMLGYAPDKNAVVPDLVRAVTDSNDDVRNNAVRALAIFSAKKSDPPRVPYEPIIALLDSATWTDLNKASFALFQISERRDPKFFAALQKPARQSLAEIARWHSRTHAQPGFIILGRLSGFSDAELFKRWLDQNNTEEVIRAGLAAR